MRRNGKNERNGAKQFSTPNPNIGMVYPSKNYGDMVVLEVMDRGLWRVRFKNTGTIVEAKISNIKAGMVKDRFAPFIGGVGYIGNASSTTNPSIYARWKRMIMACYDPYHLDYESNHLQGVYVIDRWHCYENYEKDILDKLEKLGNPKKYRIYRKGGYFSPSTVKIIVAKEGKK